MILTKFVDVKIINHNIEHYKKYYPNVKYGDIINIPVDILTMGSHIKLDFMCDDCGTVKNMKYNHYNQRKNDITYLCSKCVKKQTKQYYLKIFGVENCSQLQSVKNKKKKTNLKNWGVENVFQNDEIKKKSQNTCFKKYGKKSYTQTEEYIIKSQKTNLKNYGVEHPQQNKNFHIKQELKNKKSKYYKNLLYTGTYELDFLKYCEKIGILKDVERIYSIPYIYENKQLIYHPDFYIKKINLIIEIKSDYTYRIQENKNLSKKMACEKLNYDFIFIINKNYDIFDEKIKNLK